MSGALNETRNARVAAAKRPTLLIITPSPGGADLCAEIAVDRDTAADIFAALSEETGHYERGPEDFETRTSRAFAEVAPQVGGAVRNAMILGCTVMKLTGFIVPPENVPTPLDGVVDETRAGYYVRLLVGALTHNIGLCGYAYASENGGRLLRGVAPVAEKADQISSQGFTLNLDWHVDNVNGLIRALENRGRDAPQVVPMNPYQAFVTVTPRADVPMEVISLADAVQETQRLFGQGTIEQLLRPQFTAYPPASHSGGRVEPHLPVLLRDASGRWHGRIHPQNIRGETADAIAALQCLQSVLAKSVTPITVEGSRGDLLIYSNTRALHRRRRYEALLDGTDRYYIRLYLLPREDYRAYGGTRVFSS